MARELGALFAHPYVETGDKRSALLLARGFALIGAEPVDATLYLEQSVDALNRLQRDRVRLPGVSSNTQRSEETFSFRRPLGILPIALEAVRRIDALFEIERSINGFEAAKRKAARQEQSAPLVADLHIWMRDERGKLSRHNDVAKAMDYMLKRWESFARFLDDGRICLSNNAAERALRGIALGRKSWLFAGSDRGGERAAVMYSLIVTAKMNDVDPQAWLADVLARIADHPAQKLDELMPWNWAAAQNLIIWRHDRHLDRPPQNHPR